MNRTFRLVLIALTAGAMAASGQIPPLFVGTTNGILDELDKLLEGTAPAAEQFGQPYVKGDVVQILKAPKGIVPPGADGAPSADNPVIFTTRVGLGVDPALGKIGRFGVAVPLNNKAGDPLERGSLGPVFARVFNASEVESSSFYADSQIFTPGGSMNYPFIASVAKTDKPLDTADPDGDGLHNSWEKSLGSDSANADTDNDGLSDGAEFTAGTDMRDPKSFLAMIQLTSAGGSDVYVRWDAVPGKYYRVEYTGRNLPEDSSFHGLGGLIQATGAVMKILVPGGLADPNGHFRVRVEQPVGP